VSEEFWGLLRFLEDVDDAPEVVWDAALAMVERAVSEARARSSSQWRYHAPGELRRLRRRVGAAMRLARLAAALQEAAQAHERDLDRELREQAAQAAAERRRAQTLPAERARLEKARQRREGGREGGGS
jgi:hypothetical protein